MVIPINKPRQWTSFQAVNKVKAVIRQLVVSCQWPVASSGCGQLATGHQPPTTKIKIGHAGTLDPLASGLLLICVGKATKRIPELQDGVKVYTGTFVFGATTPCYDLEQAIDHYYPYEHISPALLDEVRHQFEGTIMQVPPMFSAVKVDGQRAYEYARRDDPTVTIQPKAVEIHSFEITGFRAGSDNPDSFSIPTNSVSQAKNLYKNPLGEVPAHLPQADFRVCCGKGTYIRSLARDFGAALGSGAFLASLRRERVGGYTLEQALTLNQVADYFTKY